MKHKYMILVVAGALLCSCADLIQQGLPDCEALISCGESVELPPDLGSERFNVLFSSSRSWQLDNSTKHDWLSILPSAAEPGTTNMGVKVTNKFAGNTLESLDFDVKIISVDDRTALKTVHFKQYCPYCIWCRTGSDQTNKGIFEWDQKGDYVVKIFHNIRATVEISGDTSCFEIISSTNHFSRDGVNDLVKVASPFNRDDWFKVSPKGENTSGKSYKLSIRYIPENSGASIGTLYRYQGVSTPITFEQKSR